MVVTAYNGISVSNFEWVRIPEGQTSITADVFVRHAGIIFVARDMEFGFPCQAGREYRVVGSTNDMIPGRTYRVDLQWLFFINRIRVRDVTPRNAR
ncbi:MAG: hypothetical protein LBG93_09145 [Treponema sp.]|jgi:hypothetical protein|nr:hypothetical protein [Treponema sp.]